MADVFLELKLYRWSPEDGSMPPTTGTLGSKVIPFENLANATAAYEDLADALADVERKGTNVLEDRVKPGPRRRSRDASVAI